MVMSKNIVIAAVLGAALAGTTGAALASHGKVGEWAITVTMGGGEKFPDMSKMPADAQARMKAMGMTSNGSSMSIRHCMTAEEVAHDVLTTQDKTCKLSNQKVTGHTMSADMACSGQVNGTGHFTVTYDSDTHYTGEMIITGTADGQPVHHDQMFDGRWVSATCKTAQ
jgi:hypothetical protein